MISFFLTSHLQSLFRGTNEEGLLGAGELGGRGQWVGKHTVRPLEVEHENSALRPCGPGAGVDRPAGQSRGIWKWALQHTEMQRLLKLGFHARTGGMAWTCSLFGQRRLLLWGVLVGYYHSHKIKVSPRTSEGTVI